MSVNNCKQCQEQWSGDALTVGRVGSSLAARWGGKFNIYKEMTYHTPIWDVFAPQREREEAG